MNKNRGFLDITPSECIDVFQSVMANAEEFFKTAELLAQNRFYGKAITHLILGTEEAIKGICLLLEGYDFELRKIKAVHGIFKYHLPRHSIVRDTFSVWIAIRQVQFVINNRTRKVIWLNLMKLPFDIFEAVDNHEWWQNADQLKQRGLYTDFRNRILQPADIKQEEYIEAQQRTKPVYEDILQFADYIVAMSPKQLKEFRQNLKDADFAALIEESIVRK